MDIGSGALWITTPDPCTHARTCRHALSLSSNDTYTFHKGKYALDIAVKTLPFYNDYFQIDYPLPKMDLIAIPDFAFGAMENWGLVTYR